MFLRTRYFLLYWSLTKLISKTRNKLCYYYIVNGCNLLVNRDKCPIQMFPLFFYHYVKPFTRSEKSRIWKSIIYWQTFRQRKEGSHDGVSCLIKTTLYTLVMKFGVKYILLLQRIMVEPLEFFRIKLSFSCCLKDESNLIKL